MAVIVIGVAVMMRMPVFMRMGAPVAICATFRGKRLFDLAHSGTEVVEHRPDHMISLDQQAGIFDLAGGMAVADVPGDPWQMVGSDLQQRLRGCDHRGLLDMWFGIFVEFDSGVNGKGFESLFFEGILFVGWLWAALAAGNNTCSFKT